MFGGIKLTLLAGRSAPLPAAPGLADSIVSVDVTHQEGERSGFQITFESERSGLKDLVDYPHLKSFQLRTGNRIVLILTINYVPRTLFDGIITHQQHVPSPDTGRARTIVTGDDISYALDLKEETKEHPAQDETIIANKLILSYAQFGLIPIVVPPFLIDPPIPLERIPMQVQKTDLAFLNLMACRYGYVFYITPGPAPLMNTAYWGPPRRFGWPQSALSMNMGAASNLKSIQFENDALKTERINGYVQDRYTNTSMPVKTFVPFRIPLSAMPSAVMNYADTRERTMTGHGGLNYMQAYARAQGATDAASDEVVTATGELDGARYGNILWPRKLVGVRGVGYTYDGIYYVKKVTHKIKKGEYTQGFTLTRDGVGSLTPVVPP